MNRKLKLFEYGGGAAIGFGAETVRRKLVEPLLRKPVDPILENKKAEPDVIPLIDVGTSILLFSTFIVIPSRFSASAAGAVLYPVLEDLADRLF